MPTTLTLPDGVQVEVPTDHPIVLLGPNGVGKTRFAVTFAQQNSADRISANRFIGLTDLPRQADNDLKNNALGAIQRQLAEYWNVHNEYTFLVAQILEEDKSKAQKYRDHHLRGQPIPKDLFQTRLKTITELWESLFPGRKLSLDYTPTVVREEAPSNPYPTAQMSEGERTALYLITRLVSSTSKIVVVDEPEIHFHPLLARRFWNAMEARNNETLFVYVTHDIPFALSRNGPTLYIVRSPTSIDKIDESGIPADAINTILGAASFSIAATRLIFCEGLVDGQEHRLLRAWYSDRSTAVIPVGGCGRVRQCVEVFNANYATKNVAAFGHIDRDDWPDDVLNSNDKIKPLPVNEIEGIVCYEPIFMALATYYGLTDINHRYSQFLTSARNSAGGFILHKHALNRAKLILELKQQQMRNSVKPNNDVRVMKTDFLAGVTSPQEGEQILDEQTNILTAALSTNDLLLKFPSKTYQAGFLGQMQVHTSKAFDDLCAILSTEDKDLEKEDSKAKLKAALIAALAPHFFPRSA